MIARRQAAVQPGRYGPRSAARGLAVSFTVSIMARAGRGQNGSCGRAAQRRRTGAEPRMGWTLWGARSRPACELQRCATRQR